MLVKHLAHFTSLALLFSPCAVHALDWKQTEISLICSPKDNERDAVFLFENKCAGMVPISSVTTSCDCTKANASKTYFEPHETGSIKVHIDFLGKKVDQVSKIIVISIENGQDTAMILKVAVKFRSTEEDDKVTPAQNKDRKKEP